MNPKMRLFNAALLGGCLCAAGFAANNEVIQLRPLDLPVVTKWVKPDFLPAIYEDATVVVTFTLDKTGQPRDLKVVEPRDPVLDKCLLPALAQCRFSPATKGGVAVEAKVVLPIKLPLFDEEAAAPMQIGALQVVEPLNQQAAPRDRDNHPAVFHVNAVKLNGQKAVLDGFAESAVREALGQPEKLSTKVWAYAKFSGLSEESDSHGCTTLLVAFEDHRVAAIALVNDRAKTRVAEQLEYYPNCISDRLQGMHEATLAAK